MKLIVSQLIKKFLTLRRNGNFFILFVGITGPPYEPDGSLLHSSLVFDHSSILSSRLRMGLQGGPTFRIILLKLSALWSLLHAC